MALPNAPAAYADCYEIWSAACSMRGGCRSFIGPDYSKAEYLRMRMHQARSIMRTISRRAYPPESPLHNTSEYDGFKVTIKQDEDSAYWLYVEPHGNWAAAATIEPIPDEELGILPEDVIKPLPPQPKAITYANRQDDLD